MHFPSLRARKTGGKENGRNWPTSLPPEEVATLGCRAILRREEE